jgi:hypothetical protein
MKSLSGILAFGGGIGSGLHAYLHGDRSRRPGTEQLSALFNLGVVLFDRLCDDIDDGVDLIAASFDERRISALCTDTQEAASFLASAEAYRRSDIRIVLKVIGLLFSELARSSSRNRAESHWTRFKELLQDAHRAEIESANSARNDDRSFDAAIRKARVPFECMVTIVGLADDSVNAIGREASAMGQNLGLFFGLLDDLVDLGDDVRRGTSNTILNEAVRTGQIERCPRDVTARWLLQAPLIEDAARRCCDLLSRILQCLGDDGCQVDSRPSFRESVLAFSGGWL